MALIGQFKRTDAGYQGRIEALGLSADLMFVPVGQSDAENAPDYRIHLGTDEDGPEVGAGWKRTGERAGEYVSLQLDSPTFTYPIRANLFQSPDDVSAWGLFWNRPPKRGERD